MTPKKEIEQIEGLVPFVVYVRTADALLYQTTYNSIMSSINAKEAVPMDSIYKFFSLFEHEATLVTGENSRKAREVAAQTFAYFCRRKGHDFSGKSRTRVKPIDGFPETGGYTTNSYTFNHMLDFILDVYYRNKRLNIIPLKDKDATIVFFYQWLDHLKNNAFNQRHKKLMTHYKAGIIAGYITQAIGFKVTPKTNPVPDDFFQGAKHAISKLDEIMKTLQGSSQYLK